MKKLILTVLMACTCLFALAQDKAAILKVLENQRHAWNNGDIETFMQTYWQSDSLLFVGKNGPTYGWQNTLARYQKSYPDKAAMGSLAFKVIKLNLLCKQDAFMLGNWKVTREKDILSGYFTLWFRKFKNGWKIIADHTSETAFHGS